MKKGFTLTEVLTVISIIGVVAAITFPAFASAKQAAMGTRSVSDMKQIAIAALLYREDWKSEDYGDMVSMGLPSDYPNLFNPKGTALVTSYPKPQIHPPNFDGYYYMPLSTEVDHRTPTWTAAVLNTKDNTVLVCDPWLEGMENSREKVWNFTIPNTIRGVSLGGALITKKPYGAWFDFTRWR